MHFREDRKEWINHVTAMLSVSWLINQSFTTLCTLLQNSRSVMVQGF